MHPSSFENMQRCFDRYFAARSAALGKLTLVDIGSADVNGSYRKIFREEQFSYIGLDFAAGPGVDIVLQDAERIPLPDNYADVVISGQVFEHCEFFWVTFKEMLRVLKPDGYLLLIAPSGGPIHLYPVDCYRFYPDAYRALAKFGGCQLIDSWHDDRGPWNDLVGVFRPAMAETVGSVAINRNIEASLNAVRSSLVASGATSRHFLGSPQGDAARGSGSYLSVLGRIQATLAPPTYLEIGVGQGHSLALAPNAAIGVDPILDLSVPVSANVKLVPETSDLFFERTAQRLLLPGVDLAFIDGSRSFDQTLRDFMNVERYSRSWTLAVIADVFPNNALQAAKTRASTVWCGDVWKLRYGLAKHRPDLAIIMLDVAPAGMLLVAGLDAGNTQLRRMYNPIVRELEALSPEGPPAEIFARTGALSPDDERVEHFLASIRSPGSVGNKSGARQIQTI
jgi:hypothetical protein